MLRRSLTAIHITLFSAFATLLVPAPDAAAKGTPPKEKATETSSAELAALDKALKGDEDSVVGALQSIDDGDKVAAAPLISKLLARGGTEKVLEAALKTAQKLKAESLSTAIAPYTRHRSEEVRRQATRALLKTKGPIAVTTLEQALRSPDAVVRGTAASGLGELHAHAALPELFLAFDKGVPEAAAALGQLCVGAECDQFIGRTGRVGFDIMQTGFDQILFRPPSEVSDDAKIKLVGKLRELGTDEVGKYLSDVAERWPKDGSKRVKQVIDSAAHSVGGGVKQ